MSIPERTTLPGDESSELTLIVKSDRVSLEIYSPYADNHGGGIGVDTWIDIDRNAATALRDWLNRYLEQS